MAFQVRLPFLITAITPISRRAVDCVVQQALKSAILKENGSLFLCRSQRLHRRIIPSWEQTRSNSSSSDQHIDDKPISYSKSRAHQHKVDDTLQYDLSRLNSVRTFAICFGLFSFIIYIGFIRQESEAEQKIFELNEFQESNQEDIIQSKILKKTEKN